MAAPCASLSTTVTTATVWLRERTAQLNAQVEQLERLQAHARQRIETKEQENRAEAAQLQQQVTLAQEEVLAAQAKQQEAV